MSHPPKLPFPPEFLKDRPRNNSRLPLKWQLRLLRLKVACLKVATWPLRLLNRLLK